MRIEDGRREERVICSEGTRQKKKRDVVIGFENRTVGAT